MSRTFTTESVAIVIGDTGESVDKPSYFGHKQKNELAGRYGVDKLAEVRTGRSVDVHGQNVVRITYVTRWERLPNGKWHVVSRGSRTH